MPRRVVLLNTAAPDRRNGSMVRYGTMVREAVEQYAAEAFVVEELNLAPTQAWLDRFPKNLQTPIRYLRIAANARRMLPKQRNAILHLLDGSHAYLLQAVRNIPVPLVITVHDMIPALCLRGEFGGGRPGRIGAWIIRRSMANLARADAWVSVSQNTKNDLTRLADIAPDQVLVAYHQADSTLDPAMVEPVRVASPYILHVAGNNTFYKNRQGVVDIFQIIRRSEPIQLKMVGAPPDAALLQKVKSSGVGDAVEFLSNVSEGELAALYRGAAFLLFPSLYEGFGWPPLEAMTYGCPVVCSNAGSLPEIVGEAALIAPSFELATLANHGLRLLRDGNLRQSMVEAGFRRAREFTLEAMAAGLGGTYRAASESFCRRTSTRDRE